MLEGGDGSKWTDDGWPSFHSSMVHTSPILYDFDYDNVQDILIATYDGEILAIKDTVRLRINVQGSGVRKKEFVAGTGL